MHHRTTGNSRRMHVRIHMCSNTTLDFFVPKLGQCDCILGFPIIIYPHQGSTIALARCVFLRVSGEFGPPVFIFYRPDGPLVSTMELFTIGIVLDSFHQLSLLIQQLNIICDSVDSRYQSKTVTSITSHSVATGNARRRREADTSLVN